jgi:hypothetical protein
MRRLVLLVSAAIVVAVPVSAQYPPIRDPYVTVTYGSASRSQDAHQQGRFPLYREDLAFDVLHSLEQATFIDIGAGARVWRGLFVGGAYAARRREALGGPIAAFVPHPVIYDQFRSAAGTASELNYKEHAVHIHAMWRFVPAAAFQIGVFGGPTLFSASHDLIEAFDVAETGGSFAQVNFGEATLRRETEGVFGAHAGLDAMYRIVRQVGVGAMVRYSRASADFMIPGHPALELTIGGLDAGVRVRIGF